MPYDLDIPGQVSEFELRAIELVASLVPQDGCIVEVGSLFGRSSWAWAKSVDPSVTVYCVDPWRKNAGIRPMEERFGITYGIEEFRKNTADCDNIEPLQGYSPHDFADWHQPIDLYYDDAVHQDPGFSDNLEFWASHLKPHGILCGDDFRPRFPDICNGVQKYAEKLERELITVDFFWCLLPSDEGDDGAKEVANKLRALASEKIRVETSRSPQIAVNILSDVRAEVGQRSARLPVRLTNLRRTPWPDHDEEEKHRLWLDLTLEGPGIESGEWQKIVELSGGAFAYDIPRDFTIDLPVSGLAAGKFDLNFELRATKAHGEEEIYKSLFCYPLVVEQQEIGSLENAGEPAIDDPIFFQRYCGREQASDVMGISQIAHQTYEIGRSDGETITVRSMLLIYELALLYALARHHFQGRGKIVDAGSLLGASTNALCKGLSANDGITCDSDLVYSFDLFSIRGYEKFLGDFAPKTSTGSILGFFNDLNRDYSNIIIPNQGNFNNFLWDGSPIEILFIDLAKNWDLHDHSVVQFFPHLIPGQSILVHQDYIHFNEYWIHIFMEYYAERFSLLGMLRGATAFFRVDQAFTEKEVTRSLQELTYVEKRELMTSAIDKAPLPVREVLKSALAKCAVDHGEFDDAQSWLDSVVESPLTDDPILEVSGIARSNRVAVAELLEAGRNAKTC